VDSVVVPTIFGLGLVDVDVTGKDKVGAMAGRLQNGVISDCYVTGAVSGSFDVGGLVGYNRNGAISRSYVTATVSGGGGVGGVLGNQVNGTISASPSIRFRSPQPSHVW